MYPIKNQNIEATISAVKLTKSDKIIISHSSLSSDIINIIEFIKISNMFIYLISLFTNNEKKRQIFNFS